MLEALGAHLDELDFGLLVNNAGFANTGAVVDNDLEREIELLNLNCRAYLVLAHALGKRFRARARGGMIFVSSTTAFAPASLWANYSASKAHEEMRESGVDVLTLCPGPVSTPFYDVANQDIRKAPRDSRALFVRPAKVVDAALRSIGHKRSVVPGWSNKLVVQSGRILPRSFSIEKVSQFVAATRRSGRGSET